MATFALINYDTPGSLDLRMATREAHLDYMRAHGEAIRLAGPFLDDGGAMSGSMILIEAPDLATAQRISANDPYALAGLFERREVRAVRITMGAIA